jgi:hypothetical protein
LKNRFPITSEGEDEEKEIKVPFPSERGEGLKINEKYLWRRSESRIRVRGELTESREDLVRALPPPSLSP